MNTSLNDPIYGPKFRELRKQEKINLVNAAKGITSKSSLDRWEKGNDNLSFSKVIELLHKIHIQPKEFLESDIPSRLAALYQQPMIAYCNNDTLTLKQLSIKYLKLTKKIPQEKSYFFQAAITCDLYEDLTGENIFPSSSRLRINEYFSNLENWTYENILYFSCIQLLLTPNLLFRLCNSLTIFSEKKHTNRQEWNSLLLEAVLNGIFTLIKRKEPQKAQELIKKISSLKFNDNYILIKIRIKFMSALVKYTSTKDATEINSILFSLQTLGLDNLHNDLKFASQQIFNLY